MVCLRRLLRTSPADADVGGLWQLARRRTCWEVGFLDRNSYELPLRGQDNKSKREVQIPIRRCGPSGGTHHLAGLLNGLNEPQGRAWPGGGSDSLAKQRAEVDRFRRA